MKKLLNKLKNKLKINHKQTNNTINYIEEYKKLHSTNSTFGTSNIEQLKFINLIIEYIKPNTILDYGCGKGTLINELRDIYPNIKFYGYDPAVPEFSTLPTGKFDLVINTDVLEHIPENTIKEVITQIKNCSNNVFFQLHHAKASQILPNGENAHCTIKPPKWYLKLLKKYFTNVILLPSRKPYLSTCLTFSVSESFIEEYNAILKDMTSNDTV